MDIVIAGRGSPGVHQENRKTAKWLCSSYNGEVVEPY